jgi:hypothetical protein
MGSVFPLLVKEISIMPTMSYYAYFAPLVSSEQEIWECRNSIHEKIIAFADECVEIGMTRGTHFSLTPLSEDDVRDIIEAPDHRFPSMVPIAEIKFRSMKHLVLATSAGIVRDADGSEEEKPIWG